MTVMCATCFQNARAEGSARCTDCSPNPGRAIREPRPRHLEAAAILGDPDHIETTEDNR